MLNKVLRKKKKQRVCGQLLPGQKPLTAYDFTQGAGANTKIMGYFSSYLLISQSFSIMTSYFL